MSGAVAWPKVGCCCADLLEYTTTSNAMGCTLLLVSQQHICRFAHHTADHSVQKARNAALLSAPVQYGTVNTERKSAAACVQHRAMLMLDQSRTY